MLIMSPAVLEREGSTRHAQPTRLRAALGYCDGCRRLCAYIPGEGWRHLLAITDSPTAPGPYVGLQADTDACDPRWLARR